MLPKAFCLLAMFKGRLILVAMLPKCFFLQAMLPRKVDSSGLDSRDWLADKAEVAIMLDTDLHIKHNLDNAFYKLTHCKIAGAFRGLGDFPLNQPRKARSIKTNKFKESGQRGGGINGGVVVFRPSRMEYHEMVRGLESYAAPDKSLGEQDYISEYFGLKEQIAPLGSGYNFQVHQFSLTMVNDPE